MDKMKKLEYYIVEHIKGLRKSKKITGEITNCDYIRKNYTQCSNL